MDAEEWYNQGLGKLVTGEYDAALACFQLALAVNPDLHEAWNNRGIALDYLGRWEEAIASYDQALNFKPDKDKAWNNRGIAAGKSVSCDRLLALQSAIARENPALNKRGYEGKLASFEQGLKHCPQDTHPEGWGILHHAIGYAHCFRGVGDSRPLPYWNKAFNSYQKALQTLTEKAFPEAHLEVLQDLLKLYDNLGDYKNRNAALAQGTVVLEALLEKTPSDAVKIQLSQKFSSFAQFYVDQLVQKGELCKALEFAEMRKNLCLGWLHSRWSKSTDSPKYAQMQELLQPSSKVPLTVQLAKGKDGQFKIILPQVRKKSVGVQAIVTRS
jgi:tetratricopeptide (TPR) repeat protein